MHMNADANLPAPTRKRVGVRGYKWGCNGDGGRGGAGLGASTDELIAALHPISTTGADGPMPEAGDRGYDVILLADVIFNHVAHAALLRSCHALLRPHDPAACVLVAFFFTSPRSRIVQFGIAPPSVSSQTCCACVACTHTRTMTYTCAYTHPGGLFTSSPAAGGSRSCLLLAC